MAASSNPGNTRATSSTMGFIMFCLLAAAAGAPVSAASATPAATAASAPRIPDIRDSYGVALADFDQDGLLDVYLVGFRTLNRLLINNGDGTFRDKSIPSGVGGNLMPQGIRNLELGAGAADYDNDGAVDILICGWGEALDLLHNRKDGTFASVTRRAGIRRDADANMGLWGDLDGDGYLDLLLTNETGPARLYRNDHGWRFLPVDLGQAGIASDTGSQGGLLGDFDLDGDLDLALAGWRKPLRIYEQTAPFRFREVDLGLALPPATRCNAVLPGDVDDDGDLDLLVTVRGGPSLLLINQADPGRTALRLGDWKPRTAPPAFREAAASLGLTDTLDAYGGAFADYDGDGDQDLFLTTRDINHYYENTGGGFLARELEEIGLGNASSTYNTGFMAGDLTPDAGDELFIVSRDSASSIQDGPEVKGRRLKVRLHGVQSNREGIGSWLMLWSRPAGAERDPWYLTQSRQVHGGEGYLSTYSGPRSFFLPDSGPLAHRLRIRFPSGKVTVRKVAPGDTLIEAWEGGFLSVAWSRGGRIAYHALHDTATRKAILLGILGILAIAALLRAAIKAMAQSIARKQYTRQLVQKNQELQQLVEELNRTQQQLIHSEKLAGLGQLVAGIAHELNNPIGFIYANLFQIRKYIEGLDAAALDDRGRNLLRKVDQALRESQDGSIRIRDIVQNLRGLSRAGSRPGTALQKKPCDLGTLLDKSLLLAQTSFSKNIAVEKDYGEVPPVEGDETQLQQVFLNILVNAGQALGEKGRIRLRTRTEGGPGPGLRAAISISDDGPGIDPDHLRRIFEPFFTTKPVGQGIGLGLHICYEIITAHQGSIEARSEPGQGAEFLIKLPLAPADAGRPQTPQTAHGEA